MSGQAAAARELIGFEGAVDCQVFTGAVSLRLRGRAAAASGVSAAEVLFSGAGTALPASAPRAAVLHQVRVLELEPALEQGTTVFRIESREGSFELRGCHVQLHRDAASRFFAALPPTRVPRATRLGWWLLLLLLRVPGVARLLAQLRG